MNATQTVRDWLRADATVAALTGGRVYQTVLPQDGELPAIALSRVSATTFNHLQGFGSLVYEAVQVDIFAAQYADAAAIRDAARSALYAAGVTLEVESEDYDAAVQLHRISQQWNVFTT